MLTHFVSQRHGDVREIEFVARPGMSPTAARELSTALESIPWNQLQHAYGPAGEVPALLYAVSLGTDPVRLEAWWELWGNIHHQGTVYEATPASIPFLARIAADLDHPDRVNALSFLRQVAVGGGTFAAQTRAAVERDLSPVLQSWQQQSELVQRALLLLTSAFPDRLTQYPELIEQLPSHLQPAWDELVDAGGSPTTLAGDEEDVGENDELWDRQGELEQWALAGWNEPSGT
ncbi:hypothetical protein ACGIF2_07800 [Cellulomonas sp. P22]|uniref:hypothetical protein n=1 Tax=Cellulomonas sp. P22 TaxID=3373189 RepID=UPI0037A8593B